MMTNLKTLTSNLLLVLFLCVILSCSSKKTKLEYIVNYNTDSTMIVSHGFVLNELKTGVWHEYFENGGCKSIGCYVLNEKCGYWQYFYESGYLRNTVTYNRGVVNGYVLNYRYGRLENKYFVKNGIAIGNTHFFKYNQDNHIPIDTLGFPCIGDTVYYSEQI